MVCLHCREPRRLHARKLCRACQCQPAIRALYPPLWKGRSGRHKGRNWNPTAEQLDRQVAARLATMPER